ncbi:phage virion morphogenesis protein [uncultured Pseudodesulfovibrio sp.]|uniref:phage virion morphogenesis protein n=1 Tax=uncultured Pseudodesulfovibrio sp. TaxID=2035858 RepID=UPI0029C6980A|nr:phage virion morphogenesis protein [uncultured Pseudodesulfovibrio sp.]
MSGVTLKMNLPDVLKHIFGIEERMQDDPRLLKIVGQIMVASVQRNFEVGGRPDKWAALSETTKKRRKGNSPLRVQGMAGGLMGSIHATVEGDAAMIGTNKVYGATHQYGAKKGSFGTVMAQVGAHTRETKHGTVMVKAHTRQQKLPWGDIPARVFLLVQDEDRENIRVTTERFVLEGRS